MKKSFNILVLCGEVSADYYGYLLAKKLKAIDADCKIFAIGGQNMASIADHFIYETANRHHIGLSTALGSKFWNRVLKSLAKVIRENQIDLAIIIDFGFYNFKLAKFLKKFSLPIVTFITPNFWIWKDVKKARAIKNYSEKIVTIYPEEYDFYKSLNADAYYFGHPLIELIPKNAYTSNKQKQILLLPGSRKIEIKLLLPRMLRTVKILKNKFPDAEFYLATANDHFKSLIESYLAAEEVTEITILINQDRTTLFKDIDLVLTASGTSTLECALFNKPMIVLGALSKVTYHIGKLVFKFIYKAELKYISLPNLILDKQVVKELWQNDLKPEVIAAEVINLLEQVDHTDLFQDYQLIREKLDLGHDVFFETAKLIFYVCHGLTQKA